MRLVYHEQADGGREARQHVVAKAWVVQPLRADQKQVDRAGTELRVYRGPESADDLQYSQVERFDIGVLETRAEALRIVLLEKGWRDAD